MDSPACPVTVSGTGGPAAAVGKGGSHVSEHAAGWGWWESLRGCAGMGCL